MDKFQDICHQNEQFQCLIYIRINGRDAYLNDDFQFENCMRILPLEQQARILEKRGRTRQIALVSQLLQLMGCCKATRRNIGDLKFSNGKFGKPRLLGRRVPAFSMSNSDGFCAMFLRRNSGDEDDENGIPSEVGLDLASTTDCKSWNDEYLNEFKDIFSVHEFTHLRKTLDAGRGRKLLDRIFTHYWSMKEAYTKFTGTGLNCDLSEIDLGSVSESDYNRNAEFIRTVQIDQRCMVFRSKWINETVVATVCYEMGSDDAGSPGLTMCSLELPEVIIEALNMK
ncbi:LAMI_0E03180g1_1 [Lachancea mirantina]|uniref:holo-[acyl-carrier-protein] synthase n=1 Tax=Lachancea mirantina TaxID=1230905 RepID=A0A1G4JJI7_9SACH|nr:LAMI_0E03180g1_1 [Lachancea mirantina]